MLYSEMVESRPAFGFIYLRLKMSLSSSVRLNKFISDSGYCSRREADKLIENNRVKVNGFKPDLGTRIAEGDEVTVDGQPIYGSTKSSRVYIAYHKPVGITCTTEQNVKGNIVDAVDHDERVFPIGRLDKPSEGLILLTSDGNIVNKILRAENAHDKEYLVTVNKALDSSFAAKMSSGIPILGQVTKPCKVTLVNRSSFKIILTQGLNRQIRRMCEYLGYEVVQLVRTRIMNIELGKLRSGQWRNLTKQELAVLSDAIANSSNETKNSKPNTNRRPVKSGSGNRDSKPSGQNRSKTPNRTKGGKSSGGHHSKNSSGGKNANKSKPQRNRSKPGPKSSNRPSKNRRTR